MPVDIEHLGYEINWIISEDSSQPKIFFIHSDAIDEKIKAQWEAVQKYYSEKIEGRRSRRLRRRRTRK